MSEETVFESPTSKVKVPIDVFKEQVKTYTQNYLTVTQESSRMMLFAGDQKVEHLNEDFYGEGISPQDNNPEHMFEIANKARIGAFATQWGLLSKYGNDFPKIPYIVKLNSKTNLVPTSQKDPQSSWWFGPADVAELRGMSKLNIVGVGYTVYLGSEFESTMLFEAASICRYAHKYGLLCVLWMYPRGKAVTDEKDPHIIAGAAGIGAALGADFVKVNAPKPQTGSSAESLKEAVSAGGRTQVICAGGSSMEAEKFLQTLHDQIHIGGTGGNATGRNIHQRPLDEAVRFCNAISSITFDNKSVVDAMKIYNG